MLTGLEKRLKELGKIVIAFSGGIDSSFLLYFANQVLPREHVLAVIVNGQMMAAGDYEEAIDFLKKNHFQYKEILHDVFQVKAFKENHRDRCYHCKKAIMSAIQKAVSKEGFFYVLDGKNADDALYYRPGSLAAKELGIISPLEEMGFTKQDIRKYSKQMGIEFWNKPSNSCLATRFPYNTVLTNEDLKKVELAEDMIRRLGISKTRVRVHHDIARIEVEEPYFETILKNREKIEKIKELGFRYITLDLDGLTSGSFDL
ncbi:MAG: ATP-dependent sacrificial sulfur transferase LarE [Lachnospiraceae bacterium]|nr:ATP-dependent sacrificial sulfur transferase LarE [Lachnospiraceae bacterium]